MHMGCVAEFRGRCRIFTFRICFAKVIGSSSFEIGGYGEGSYFESEVMTQPRMSGHLAPTVYTTVKGYH